MNNNNEYDEESNEFKEAMAHLNGIVVSENPVDYLPELGPINRKDALELVELTHRGIINPSYGCYGFLLLKTLCNTDDEVRAMFGNGAKFVEESGNITEEEIEEVEKRVSMMIKNIADRIKKINDDNIKN